MLIARAPARLGCPEAVAADFESKMDSNLFQRRSKRRRILGNRLAKLAAIDI